jgi:hypothetical protein
MQYTGNEETIASFADFVSKADYDDMGGDYVKFEIDTENKVSENTANEMIKCYYGSYSYMFSKLTGKMVDDPFDGDSAKDMTGHEIATLLSDKFFGNRITELFVETYNYSRQS